MPLTFEIPYPIPASFERQLMDSLPTGLKSDRSRFLKQALKDFHYTGKQAARLRRAKKTELKRPVKRRWGGFWAEFYGGFETTSNIILEMALFVGPIQPSHARALCYLFGLLPEEVTPDILARPEEFSSHLRPIDKGTDAAGRYFRLLAESAAGGGQIEIVGAP